MKGKEKYNKIKISMKHPVNNYWKIKHTIVKLKYYKIIICIRPISEWVFKENRILYRNRIRITIHTKRILMQLAQLSWSHF